MTKMVTSYDESPYHTPRPPKYHITAINPLTRLRESITLPCPKDTAEKMLAKLKKTPHKRTWLYPKLEVYSQQQYFDFHPNKIASK